VASSESRNSEPASGGTAAVTCVDPRYSHPCDAAQQDLEEFSLVTDWPADLSPGGPITGSLRACFGQDAASNITPLSGMIADALLKACLRGPTSISAEQAVARQVIQTLESGYQFRRRSEVVAFLQEHLHLTELLRQAPRHIAAAFGDAPLVLEVHYDPELEDETTLLLGIQVDMDPLQALDTLAQVEDDWWLDLSPAADGRLSIDVEFV